MAAPTLLQRNVDLKLTESYMMNLVGVVDASVFWHDGDICAHVEVLDNSFLTSRDVQMCVMQDLGLHQTPRHITLAKRMRRAA